MAATPACICRNELQRLLILDIYIFQLLTGYLCFVQMYVFKRPFSLLIYAGFLSLFRSERKARDVREVARLNSIVLHEFNFRYPNPTREDFKPALPYP